MPVQHILMSLSDNVDSPQDQKASGDPEKTTSLPLQTSFPLTLT